MNVLKLIGFSVLEAAACAAMLVAWAAQALLISLAVLIILGLLGNPEAAAHIGEEAGIIFFAFIGLMWTAHKVAIICEWLFNELRGERKQALWVWRYDRETRRLYPNTGPSWDF